MNCLQCTPSQRTIMLGMEQNHVAIIIACSVWLNTWVHQRAGISSRPPINLDVRFVCGIFVASCRWIPPIVSNHLPKLIILLIYLLYSTFYFYFYFTYLYWLKLYLLIIFLASLQLVRQKDFDGTIGEITNPYTDEKLMGTVYQGAKKYFS